MAINNKAPVSISDQELENKVAEYLMETGNPSDVQFHAFAAGIGVSKDRLEEVAYKMLSSFLRITAFWNLLGRDPQEMSAYLYQVGVDVPSSIGEIQVNVPGVSINIAETLLRVRNADHIDKQTLERARTLSSIGEFDDEVAEDLGIDQNLSDRVAVSDQRRIAIMNIELENRGLTQSSIDTASRLLSLDGFSSESSLISASYSSMREALAICTTYCYNDPLFDQAGEELKRAGDNRERGNRFRIAAARQTARIFREIAAKYGISSRSFSLGI